MVYVVPVGLLLVMSLAILLGVREPAVAEERPGLAVVTFHDTGFQRPAEAGVDPQIHMQLENVHDCSKLWLGRIRFPVGGRVTLSAEAEQGVRVYVGGEAVIDGWGPGLARKGNLEVTAGESRPLRVEYYHLGHEAFLRLYWEWEGQARELVPASAFWHDEEDFRNVEALAAGKAWAAPGNHGPVPMPDSPVVEAPAGDEAFKASLYEPGRSPATEPIPLGEGPHLFIDDYLIESSEGLQRRVNRPQRDPTIPNPIITGKEDRNYQPYMTILRDPETGRFRMWYGMYTLPPQGAVSHVGYIESTDGIHWERPARQLADAGPIQFGCSVLDDGPLYPDPQRRYKLAWWWNGGLNVATSPDGLHWTMLAPYPVLRHNHDINNLFRDTLRNRYVATISVYTTGPTWSGLRRVTMQSTSKDLLHWSKPWYILTPVDGVDPGETQFYAMNGHLIRGDLWIGLVKVLRDDLRASGTPEGSYGIGYTTLAWTRDGEHWVRDPEPFFEPDPEPGAWDHAHAWLDWQLTVGDEVFIYYGGYKNGHKVNRFEERQIGLVRMVRDRYVAREAGQSPGLLRTPPVILQGGEMTVNARVRGELRVQVVGERGEPLPGFSFADCTPIVGDSVAHPVRWTGGGAGWEGAVRLEFRLVDGELYGFAL